jgi:hypothetical protein
MKIEINFAMSRLVTRKPTEGAEDQECKRVPLSTSFLIRLAESCDPVLSNSSSFFQLKALIVEDRVNKCE